MGFTNVKSQSPGKAASDSKKADSKLSQHGGEGGGKTASIPSGSGGLGFTPKKGSSYGGPGRNLETKGF